MSGAIIAGVSTVGLVSAAAGVASAANNIANSGGSGGSGAGGSGGGSSIQSNEQKFYSTNAANTYSGVNVSVNPMSGKQAPVAPEMAVTGKAVQGHVATARDTPTQPDGVKAARQDTNNEWASRLSKYLDYNTRALG